jgi:hypothetical protein
MNLEFPFDPDAAPAVRAAAVRELRGKLPAGK